MTTATATATAAPVREDDAPTIATADDLARALNRRQLQPLPSDLAGLAVVTGYDTWRHRWMPEPAVLAILTDDGRVVSLGLADGRPWWVTAPADEDSVYQAAYRDGAAYLAAECDRTGLTAAQVFTADRHPAFGRCYIHRTATAARAA